MKRIFIMLSVLLSVILAIPSFAFATSAPVTDETPENRMNERSSAYIDPRVLDALTELEVAPFDEVVKLYNVPVISAFSNYGTIEEVLKNKYTNQILYVIVCDNAVREVYISKNQSAPVKAVVDLRERIDMSAYFDETIIKKVSQDTQIYNVYFLYGHFMHEGIALYYETNMGDYVYYYNHFDGEYLMPSDAFVDYMKALYSEMLALEQGKSGGAASLTFDLSNYDLNSSAFNPRYLPDVSNKSNEIVIVAIIAVSVLLAATAVGVIFWKRKKHNA